MAKKLLKFLLITLSCLILVSASLLTYGYFYGLKALPEDTMPTQQPYPEIALDALWVSMGGYGERIMKPLYPWHWLRAFSGESTLNAFPNSTTLSNSAARGLIFRKKQAKQKMSSWHLSYFSVSIWLSRHWTADEALSTILSETYFGNCKYGIDQAAQGYFGKYLNELKPESIVILVALTKSPHAYNPWKYPERSKEETLRLINLIGTKNGNGFKSGEDYLLSELLPKPATECKMI